MQTGKVRWPWWRRVMCGVGLAVLVGTMVASPSRFPGTAWLGGADVGVANVVASFFLLVGWPRRGPDDAARPDGPGWRAVRWLAHPLVMAPLNCLLLVLLFTTGLYDRAAAGQPGWSLLMLAVLLGGLAADAAVLVPGLLPSGGPGMQVLFATVCGLVDELPGIAVMALHRHEAGVAMWIVAQPVIFPVLIVLMVQWVRHDQRLAREQDAELDALEAEQAARRAELAGRALRRP